MTYFGSQIECYNPIFGYKLLRCIEESNDKITQSLNKCNGTALEKACTLQL